MVIHDTINVHVSRSRYDISVHYSEQISHVNLRPVSLTIKLPALKNSNTDRLADGAGAYEMGSLRSYSLCKYYTYIYIYICVCRYIHIDFYI